LIVFQLVCIGLVTVIDVPLPGPVVGLGLLALALVIGRGGQDWRFRRVEPAADSLLELLPLLFVPAGVGVVEYLPVLNEYLLAVVLAVGLSFVLALLGTGAVLELFLRWQRRSLLTRSVTSPVAIGVAEQIGAIPALAAVFTIFAGVLGAVDGPYG
jgi:holin-like protein